MEWREQPTLSCEVAFTEGQRWVEEVTGKKFGSNNFRSALENGVLLCDLINKLKPGIIKRVNRLSTPIAGLDNVNVFLKACGKLGLNDAQLFDPGDLQDVSTRVTVRHKETSRRLKNVLITIYWLGRKAQSEPSYSGPQLNFKAFEGLLGVALSKALDDFSCFKSNVRDGGLEESWFPNRTERCYKREDSSESLDSVESYTQSLVSDSTLVAGSEGFDSDAEAEHCFRMSECNRKEVLVATRDRRHVPAALRRKRSGQHEDEHWRASPILRSKSMGDIPLEPVPQNSKRSMEFGSLGSPGHHQGKVFLNPTAINRVNLEQLQHFKARLKESEARWQEDLNRWKSRRRSTNSELHKKKEEREQLELVINKIALQQKSEQEEFPVFVAPQQHPNKVDMPSSIQRPSSNALAPFQSYAQREESHLGQLSSEKAFAPSAASPFTSSCSMPAPMSSSQSVSVLTGISLSGGCRNINSGNTQGQYTQPIVTYQGQEVAAGLVDEPGTTDDLASLSTPQPDSGSASGHSAPVLLPRAYSLEGASSGTTQMSTSLPRGFRRSEGTSRLSTGVTPRPFGSKLTRMSSLPKFCLMSDSTNISNTQQAQLPASCPSMNINEERTHSSSHPAVHWNKVEEGKHGRPSAPIIHSFMSASVLTPPSKHSNPHTVMTESKEDKVDHDDFRVSLNQKPSNKGNFGFQAHWDSTGARIRSINPGSPAQLCHLQVGDEIVVLGGRRVADMSYEQWKANMDAALQEGKLLMDIRRKILNGHSDQCNTITNTSSSPTDEVAKVPVNNHPANGLPVKEEIKSVCDGSVPSKGGSESAISDIQVPSISASSSRWSWDTKEERRKQEKWQMEQERLLQEKYQRDQERMEEEWRRAQQEVAQVDYSNFEKLEDRSLSNGNTKHSTPPTPPSPPCQAVSSTFGASCPSAVDSEPVQNRQVQMSTSYQPKERCDPITRSSQWSSESSGFAKLTAMDRKKSKSTPSLDGSLCEAKRAAVGVKNNGRLSQAEQDRQVILDEMKKKTPLLTDSSWIRQQISDTTTEKKPVRRYESLDNLHISSNSSKPLPSSSQTTMSRATSLCAGPYRGYSGRCSLGPNAAIFSSSLRPSSWSRPISGSLIETVPCVPNSPTSQQQSRLVSRRRQCYRCKQSLGKGLAIVIESLDISFHLKCFKCVSCRTELEGGSEFGPQVRVRHRQLLCDTCYSRFRVQPGTPK